MPSFLKPADAAIAQTLRSEATDVVGAKTKVIGLYGIPGSGKTHLLNVLRSLLDQSHFIFFEGSEVIGSIVPGGLKAFQDADEKGKFHWRKLAIEYIKKESIRNGQVAIVTGHLMFWQSEAQQGQMVYTDHDLNTYTHIIYLDIAPHIIQQRNREDTMRARPPASESHLRNWQNAEKEKLEELCRKHHILFSVLDTLADLTENARSLIEDFRIHDERHNLSLVQKQLDRIFASYEDNLEKVFVFDADKTLAAEDTGTIFWKKLCQDVKGSPLNELFGGPLQYSYTAFRQAVLLYEEAARNEGFEDVCREVASVVNVYPEFLALLRLIVQQKRAGAVIVSCGLRRVWEIVLENEGLDKDITVIAGGRIADGFVVDASVKEAIVARLQDFHRVSVCAFGDSTLDLDMLKRADRAIVVVGNEQARSKSMEEALARAIDDGLQAEQIIIPNSARPRLDLNRLPELCLDRAETINSLLSNGVRRSDATLPVWLATNKSASKLLATSMRNAKVSGPALREAHRIAGRYLATEFLSHVIGLEDCEISHVLGHVEKGFRLLFEEKTTIMALMRAGEPMALGVNDVYPLAMLLHANKPEDIKSYHLQGKKQVILVDSVMNSGKTILQFMEAIRKVDADIMVVVVVGVVQAQCVSRDNQVYRALAGYGNVSLVGLRLSDTKFTGSRSTDTGNRLFNTTHLD